MTDSKAGGEGRLRVLVADDVKAVRYTLVLEMEDEGWSVDEAGSVAELESRLAANAYDVLVTDIWMPDGDGISVIKSIRRTHPGLRVFAISGGGPGLSLASAASLAEVWGAEKLLVKPFDVSELIAAIRRQTSAA
jgi:two-component system chemotaxis response regulator CheY